jgi:hypothetical protein
MQDGCGVWVLRTVYGNALWEQHQTLSREYTQASSAWRDRDE